jgi:hypothetical protein
MKNPNSRPVPPAGLIAWLKQPASPSSIALGATCGCNIARLGRQVCEKLESAASRSGAHYRAFDPDEIRLLAGDPFWRHAIFAAAARKGIDLESGCDYDCMVRAIAAMGGAVLSGEWAIESTARMDQVFRVALSRCERCCPASTLHLDPDGYSPEGLARIIAKRFLHWDEDRETGRKPRVPRESKMAVLL